MAFAAFDAAELPHAALADTAPAPGSASCALPEPVRHLLVALDGTSYAERALPYAVAFARSAGLAVTVAHVRTPAHALLAERLADALHHPLQHAQHAQHANGHHVDAPPPDIPNLADVAVYMQWIQHSLRRSADGVVTRVALVDAPSAATGLRELQEQHEQSVTVLASHARQGAERLLLGSVADDLVRHGIRPVLVIPPGAREANEEVPSLARVLVPLDGSHHSERALAVVVGWLGAVEPSERRRFEVTLLTVAESQVSLDEAGDYVQAMRDELGAALPDVQVRAQAFVGSPPGMIVAAASEGLPHHALDRQGVDLVVMATHGRGRLGRWLYGSVASYVVPHVHVPVLLVAAPHVPDI